MTSEAASIDSTAPNAYLPYRLESTAGATTMIVFRVEDEAPRATVTLRLEGPVDRTFTRTVKTNENVRWRLPGKLKAGRYKAFLSAVDAAGNTTATMASRSMTVNPRPSGGGSLGLMGSGSGGGKPVTSGGSSGGGGGDDTVYVTDTGDKFHADGCRYLSQSKHAMTRAKAEASGYEPCSVCNP